MLFAEYVRLLEVTSLDVIITLTQGNNDQELRAFKKLANTQSQEKYIECVSILLIIIIRMTGKSSTLLRVRVRKKCRPLSMVNQSSRR